MSSDLIRAVAFRRARERTRLPEWDLRLVLQFLTVPPFERLETETRHRGVIKTTMARGASPVVEDTHARLAPPNVATGPSAFGE